MIKYEMCVLILSLLESLRPFFLFIQHEFDRDLAVKG